MKLNEKYFRACVTEPVEVQNMEDGSVVEIHILNDNPFFEKVVYQNQFSVWSIDNGNVYRVFLEKGYYKIMKDLYSQRIDSYWVNYWKECDKARRDFFFKLIMPIIVVFYGVVFAIGFILQQMNQESTIIMIIISLIGMLLIFSFSKRILGRKLKQLNVKVLNHIKKVVGAKKFESMIIEQRKYVKNFFVVEEVSANGEVKEIEKKEEEE